MSLKNTSIFFLPEPWDRWYQTSTDEWLNYCTKWVENCIDMNYGKFHPLWTICFPPIDDASKKFFSISVCSSLSLLNILKSLAALDYADLYELGMVSGSSPVDWEQPYGSNKCVLKVYASEFVMLPFNPKLTLLFKPTALKSMWEQLFQCVREFYACQENSFFFFFLFLSNLMFSILDWLVPENYQLFK